MYFFPFLIEGDKTQLQWRFDRPPVVVRDFFPHNVRVQCRAYSNSSVVEIVPIGEYAVFFILIILYFPLLHTVLAFALNDNPNKAYQ